MSKKDKKPVIDNTHPPVQMRDCKLMEHAHATHSIIVQRPMTAKELESPDIYSNVASRLSLRDFLVVQSIDGSMVAFGLVTAKSGTAVKVWIYQVFDTGDVVQEELKFQGYLIRLNSINGDWSIYDEKDGQLVKEGLSNQEAAVKWLTDFFKSDK